jgi:hypothetical protein
MLSALIGVGPSAAIAGVGDRLPSQASRAKASFIGERLSRSRESLRPATIAPREERHAPSNVDEGPARLRGLAMTGLRYGGPAPDFTLPSTGGGTVSLSSLKGKDVVLVFYCYDFGSI